MLMLLYFFNPIVTSLRGLQQASELKNVQAKLGCARASLGSLSESTTVFDAERLKDIIGELGQQLQPLALDKRLQNIDHTITLVDGSLIAALPRIMEASFRKAATVPRRSRAQPGAGGLVCGIAGLWPAVHDPPPAPR